MNAKPLDKIMDDIDSMPRFDDETAKATWQRIVACYNALAGLNPEAVNDVVEALDGLVNCFDDEGLGRDFDGVRVGVARAALAKLKGK